MVQDSNYFIQGGSYMALYRVDQIRYSIKKCFNNAGLSEKNAYEIGEQLLYAERRGIKSHGLVRIKWILNQLNKYPQKDVSCIIKNGNCELYDSDGVLGYLALNQIIEQLESADNQTFKMIGVQNTYPTGALSYFAEKIAQKGWVVLMSSTSPRRVSLFGDNTGLVGTNPWTFALPIKTPLGGYVVVDTSLAELTHGQCLNLLESGNPVPESAASLPGGKKILSSKDLWKGNDWNAIIHPIGKEKSYKAFGIMWSLHVIGLRMLGLPEGSHGTFFVLLSPAMWSPAISKSKLIDGFKEELKIIQDSSVAHIPGQGRMQHFLNAGEMIELSDAVADILDIKHKIVS